MSVTTRDFLIFDITPADIASAALTATAKNANVNYNGFIQRQPMKMLDDFFRGDLAKSVFKRFLRDNDVTNVIDYDDVRTDGFAEPRLRNWHICVNDDKKIEINSSVIPSRWDLNRIAQDGDVKITKEGSSPFDLTYDIAVQMYFNPIGEYDISKSSRIRALNKTNAQILLPDILDVDDRYMEVVGVAWVSQTDVEEFRLENVRNHCPLTWSFPNSDREYWDCKIRKCNPFATIISNL